MREHSNQWNNPPWVVRRVWEQIRGQIPLDLDPPESWPPGYNPLAHT